MAFEEYKPNKTKAQALYAVPLRLINDQIMIKKSDIPERFQADLSEFMAVLDMSKTDEYMNHYAFNMFISVEGNGVRKIEAY